jgi:hypothetical protein
MTHCLDALLPLTMLALIMLTDREEFSALVQLTAAIIIRSENNPVAPPRTTPRTHSERGARDSEADSSPHFRRAQKVRNRRGDAKRAAPIFNGLSNRTKQPQAIIESGRLFALPTTNEKAPSVNREPLAQRPVPGT